MAADRHALPMPVVKRPDRRGLVHVDELDPSVSAVLASLALVRSKQLLKALVVHVHRLERPSHTPPPPRLPLHHRPWPPEQGASRIQNSRSPAQPAPRCSQRSQRRSGRSQTPDRRPRWAGGRKRLQEPRRWVASSRMWVCSETAAVRSSSWNPPKDDGMGTVSDGQHRIQVQSPPNLLSARLCSLTLLTPSSSITWTLTPHPHEHTASEADTRACLGPSARPISAVRFAQSSHGWVNDRAGWDREVQSLSARVHIAWGLTARAPATHSVAGRPLASHRPNKLPLGPDGVIT